MPSKRSKSKPPSLLKVLSYPITVFTAGMLSIAAFSFVFIF